MPRKIRKSELLYLREMTLNGGSSVDRMVVSLLADYDARGEEIKRLTEIGKKRSIELKWLKIHFNGLKHVASPIANWWKTVELSRINDEKHPMEPDYIIMHASVNGQLQVSVTTQQLRNLCQEVERAHTS